MKNNRPSVDGFVPRRVGSQLGELHGGNSISSGIEPADRTLHSGDDQVQNPIGTVRVGQAIGRSDIDQSLREIDNVGSTKKLSRRQRRRLAKLSGIKSKTKKSRVKRIIKWVLILALIGVVGAAAYTAYHGLIGAGKIFSGNPLDIFTQPNQPLKQDSNGRTNILILGTSQDDPGHPAGNLTDSMMILSVDQNQKNVYMISVPRDLYVQYGVACDSGYSGKINVYYSCVTNGSGVDAQRAALTKSAGFIGKIFGLDIQYGVNVDYTVFRDVVDALGGTLTVTINSRDPQGQMDSNFDWKCGANYYTRLKNCPPDGHFIQYTNGQHVIDAEHALYLAQARGDVAPTYGFEQSNFDREKNQQMLIRAIRDKATSAGTLADIGNVDTLITKLGDNLRTTFAASEVKTLVSLAQSIKSSDIHTVSLIDGTSPIMTTGNINGQSSVYPAAGQYNYSDLQALIAKSLSSNPVVRENSGVVVLNGSGVSGAAQSLADTLQSDGFVIDTVASAPTGTYAATQIYVVDSTKTATLAKLQELYPKAVIKTSAPPIAVASSVGFVVVVGTATTP